MRLLIDEMYPLRLADAVEALGIDAVTVKALDMGGRSDADIFAFAVQQSRAILTENVGDFTQISAQHLTAGRHHSGVLIALSSRFSRRPSGVGPLAAAVHAVYDEQLDDRVLYLERSEES
ncbi:MAG: DUF5615 family PIN-like protein [Solirubrobacteraceae bacterium]